MDNWRQAEPQAGHFLFRAGVDGEYWFDVRTLDRCGQVRPQGPRTPKLIVIVDTFHPRPKSQPSVAMPARSRPNFHMEELYPIWTAWQSNIVWPDRRLANGPHRDRKTSAATTPNITGEVTGIRKMPRGRWRFAFASATWPAIRRKATSARSARSGKRGGKPRAIRVGTRHSCRTDPLGPRTPIAPAATVPPASLVRRHRPHRRPLQRRLRKHGRRLAREQAAVLAGGQRQSILRGRGQIAGIPEPVIPD